jgi:hypothetical protein
MLDIRKGDVLFLSQAHNPMVEHLVEVKDMNDGIIETIKAVTLTKVQMPNDYKMVAVPFSPLGITTNTPAIEGGDPATIYIPLDHFDAYGIVKNKKVLDTFVGLTSKILSVMSPDEVEELANKNKGILGKDQTDSGSLLI